MAAAVLAAAFLFVGASAARAADRAARVGVAHANRSSARFTSTRIAPTDPDLRRRRRGRGAGRLELHRPHRSRRRHAHARRAAVSIRRARASTPSRSARRRPLHRHRTSASAVSACAARRATSSRMCRRLGGFGIVAHPDSAKPACSGTTGTRRSTGSNGSMPTANGATSGRPQLARALARYPFRPAETLASLLDRPDATLERWDALTQRRPVVALAGADAHARAGWMDDDVQGYRRGWFLRIPSYDASFRTFAMRVDARAPARERRGRGCGAHHRGAEARGTCIQRSMPSHRRPRSSSPRAVGGRRINQGESFNEPGSAAHVHGAHECPDRRRDRRFEKTGASWRRIRCRR